jgi:hypothetical protein
MKKMGEQDRQLGYASPATPTPSKHDSAGFTPIEWIAAFIFFSMIGVIILSVLTHWIPFRWFL